MLTSENIDKETNQDGLILVKFISESCKECKKLELVLRKINYSVYTVDVDREPDLKEDYDIDIIPSIIIFLNGQKVHTIIGFKTKTSLFQIIENYKN